MIPLAINLLIGLLVLGVVFVVLRWAAGEFGLPPVVVKVAGIVLVIVALIWLLQLVGGGPVVIVR